MTQNHGQCHYTTPMLIVAKSSLNVCGASINCGRITETGILSSVLSVQTDSSTKMRNEFQWVIQAISFVYVFVFRPPFLSICNSKEIFQLTEYLLVGLCVSYSETQLATLGSHKTFFVKAINFLNTYHMLGRH